jgi:TadE-like protein.
MVELAIAVPVLLLVVIGVADFSRIFFTGIAVADRKSAAAEFGASKVDGTPNNDTSIVNQVGRDEAADAGSIVVTSERFCRCPDGTTPDCAGGTCPSPYNWLEVFVKAKASKTVNLIIRYPGIPQSVTFRDSAIFRAQ